MKPTCTSVCAAAKMAARLLMAALARSCAGNAVSQQVATLWLITSGQEIAVSCCNDVPLNLLCCSLSKDPFPERALNTL